MLNLRNLRRMKRKYSGNLRRFLPGFLDNLSVREFSRRPGCGPILVTWDMNHRCNIKCSYCDCWKNKAATEELSLEDKVDIIAGLGRAKVWYLSFCGGEPLLEENLDLFIKEAREKGMMVNVSTNGFLLEEKAEVLIGSGVNHITISIESHIADMHDSIRGREGLLRKIEQGIESLRSKRSGQIPFISIRTLVNKKTYVYLPDFIRYWENKVDDIVFKPICENKIFFKIPSEMSFSLQDKEDFEASFLNFLKVFGCYDNLYNRGISDYFFNKGALKKYRCFAGTFFADIDPEGNVYQCGEKRDILGSLKGQEFLTIWNSDRAKEVRSLLKRNGCSEDCWAESFLLNTFLTSLIN